MKSAAWVCLLLMICAQLRAAPAFEPRACDSSATAAGARCGLVYVPENHAKPRGRKIGLKVLVLPATGQPQGSRAQYDLEGGPGFAATDFLEFYAGEGAPYRAARDIVLADMRGTGGSNPLRCFGIEEYEKRQPLAPMYPPELVAECAAQSSVASDPRQYSTQAAAQDIEWVRRALGYEELDLNAISYGTTLALRYIADYPKRVHSAVLMGTVAPRYTPPRFHATAAEASLRTLAAQFPDLDANLARAMDRASQGPDIRPFFMEKLRTLLYAPATRARVPELLVQAARGDFSAFAGSGAGRMFADGLYLSITCAESFGEMNVEAAIDASRDTRFGAYRLERQRAACERWPRAPRDAGLMKMPASKVPVLFIAGELDPVSPAAWAHETAAGFPNGRVVSVPRGAHVLDGLSGLDTCLDATVIRFYDTADARGLDVECFARMQPEAGGGAP
jgi:pimeloyl-ACP methyl ester carboxylesterase